MERAMKRLHHRVGLHRLPGVLVAAAMLAAGVATGATPVRADGVVEIASRGQLVRALVLMPSGKPIGAIVLLTGGNGRLDIGADGRLATGGGNQLVRTRANYARAGYAVLVPDVAPDLKQGNSVTSGSRWSQAQADDVAAVVKHARTLAPAVHLVATSRGTLPAIKVATTKTAGPERPDTLVVTAGMLMDFGGNQPSAQKSVGHLDRIGQPTLLVWHKNDGCAYTPASSAARAKPLFKGAKRVDIRIIDGGQPMPAGEDPCNARSPHGFLGLDQEVVDIVTTWIAEHGR